MAGHDPGSYENAVTRHSPHRPAVGTSGTLQYGSVGGQSALVEHEVHCPSTGETKSSIMVDTAKRNAARLAPPLCSERISPQLCRCFSFSSKDEGKAESTSAFGLHLKRRRSNPFAGDRRAPPWLGSRCLHPFSPLFDATTIAHNARPVIFAVVAFEAVISLLKKKKSRIWRGGDCSSGGFNMYSQVRLR